MRGRIKGKGGVQVKEIANTVTKKDVGGKGIKKNHQHFKLERNVDDKGWGLKEFSQGAGSRNLGSRKDTTVPLHI